MGDPIGLVNTTDGSLLEVNLAYYIMRASVSDNDHQRG